MLISSFVSKVKKRNDTAQLIQSRRMWRRQRCLFLLLSFVKFNHYFSPPQSCQLIGSLRYSPNDDARGLICCVVPLMSITPREITLPPSSFFVITDLNFVVNKCDTKLRHYIELEHEDMLDVSIYSMIHPNDIDNLQRAHQQLLNKGQR